MLVESHASDAGCNYFGFTTEHRVGTVEYLLNATVQTITSQQPFNQAVVTLTVSGPMIECTVQVNR